MQSAEQGISDRDYFELCTLIRAECGIAFGEGKRLMVESRLRRRARTLGIGSLAAYCGLLRGDGGRGSELPHLIDAVTTHKTDFFREPAHFSFLTARAVPDLARTTGAGTRRPLRLWSSACSTGQEPYTLAMALAEYARGEGNDGFRFQITGSDISTAVLETAAAAVYGQELIRPLPADFQRYLLRSRDRSRKLVRIAPELRSLVKFQQVNLMDSKYPFGDPFDVVFCRNVMIYFDRATQASVLQRVSTTLRAGGYLFMGHSESLCGLDLPLEQVAATVYRRPNA